MASFKTQCTRLLPILTWGKQYTRNQAVSDTTAAIIVTLMLVPQALAYAMLSGLPPQVGLYASMLPLIGYALFGTSSALAVGPVAVAALMTATAIAPFSQQSTALGMQAAVILAAISGLILLFAGLLRLGFLANFLSHAVIAGFISAASIVITVSQLPTLLGFSANGDNLIAILNNTWQHIDQLHRPTVFLSIASLAVLMWARVFASNIFQKLGMSIFWAKTLARSAPAVLVLMTTYGVHLKLSIFNGVKTVGDIPAGLPALQLPNLDMSLWHALWLPALLITIVGYVESISVAQNLAMKRRERIDPDQELIALGVANGLASVSAGLPVTGGVSRSVVNADAGAATPAAGLFTAFGIFVATLFLATWLSALPRFVLASTIVVAVLSLFDANIFYKTWVLSRRDFIALIMTFSLTLLVSVEWGIAMGVMIAIGLHLYRSSHPHTAVVGHVAGTEHFRNIDRHAVDTCKHVVTLRIDESLYFANARFLEQKILEILADNKNMQHLVLMCSAVNDLDASAIEVLESINLQLKETGIGFHLSEVKGPVMDKLARSHLLSALNGKVFLTQFKAYEALSCFNNA
jgi:SulP family sulfate permease